jgi:hypothetical protein
MKTNSKTVFLKKIKALLKRSKWIIVLYNIYDNWRIKTKFYKGNIEDTCGSTHSRLELRESIRYISDVFNDYLKIANITKDMLQGKKVLEIGPGDNLGVALKFLAAGASEVVCIDKFYSKKNKDKERLIYSRLVEELTSHEKENLRSAITIGREIIINPQKLKCLYGVGTEYFCTNSDRSYFDIIISRAVLEYIFNIDEVLQIMKFLLAQQGYMIHKIDLRDHGLFSGCGMHPLTFLTIPNCIYNLMTKDSGKSNRKLISYYKQKMQELNLQHNIYVTHVLEKKEIEPIEIERIADEFFLPSLVILNEIKFKFTKEYQELPEKDLMVTGIFLVAQKQEN